MNTIKYLHNNWEVIIMANNTLIVKCLLSLDNKDKTIPRKYDIPSHILEIRFDREYIHIEGVGYTLQLKLEGESCIVIDKFTDDGEEENCEEVGAWDFWDDFDI